MKQNPEIKHLRTLEQFEGDLLSVVEIEGELYAEKWCDVEDKDSLPWTMIYVLTKTSEEKVSDYLAKRIDLKTLMHSTPQCWIVTTKGDVVIKVEETLAADLPPVYLPQAGCFHDESLSPDYN